MNDEILQEMKNIFPSLESNYLRSHLYDFGYPIETNEMTRADYLGQRLSKSERGNLIEISKTLSRSACKDKLGFFYALFGIGSSTYPERYYEGLESFLLENHLTRDDFIIEQTWSWGDQYHDYKNYKDYKIRVSRENAATSFDERKKIISKEEFYSRRNKEQEPYEVKKSIGPILDRKGEDLDFLVRCDLDGNIDNYRNKYLEFKINFEEALVKKGVSYTKEGSYLMDHDYNITPEGILRFKFISGHDPEMRETFRIPLDGGRDFHVYFAFEEANDEIRRERINWSSFVQLVRRNNDDDLISAIKNGEKSGTYENPLLVEFIKHGKISI